MPIIVEVTTTLKTPEQAEVLTHQVLSEGLAACIQWTPIRSHYRWKGKLCCDEEMQCTLKTTPERRAALLELLCQKHPYEVPEILCHERFASEAYALWVTEQVASDKPS